MQSKKMSFIESWTNVAIGYAINFVGQLVIYPLVGIHCRLRDNLTIGAFFTVVSVVRSYCVRRWFNSRQPVVSFGHGRRRYHLPGQKPRA